MPNFNPKRGITLVDKPGRGTVGARDLARGRSRVQPPAAEHRTYGLTRDLAAQEAAATASCALGFGDQTPCMRLISAPRLSRVPAHPWEAPAIIISASGTNRV